MAGASRYVGGVKFISERPGTWYSENETFSIIHVFEGVKDSEQWELYRMGFNRDGTLNDMHDLVTHALSFSELCHGESLEKLAGVMDDEGPAEYDDE